MAVSTSRQTQRRRDGCTECRRKKVKCDLRIPTCSRCGRYPKGCIYELGFISLTAKCARPNLQKNTEYLRSEAARLGNACIVPIKRSLIQPDNLVHQPLLYFSPPLSSKEARFFMHVFCTETALRLFPAAPPLFLQTMISAASETPHLLYALLAAACSHHGRLVPQEPSQRTKLACLKFTNLAISNLRLALLDADQLLKPEIITTAMALCTNDVCNGNMHTWGVHFNGVMRLLNIFVEQNQDFFNEDLYAKCLVKWFATMDILASLSGLHTAQSELLDTVSIQSPGQIDEICGFSMELVPLLVQISSLAHHQVSSSPIKTTSYDADSQAERLETKLGYLVGAAVSDATICSRGHLATELLYTHLAFVHSALLHLHRHIQQLPKDHVKVRNDVRHIIDAIQHIEPFSSANILILWPVFSAGCETDIIGERDFIQNRMRNMQSLGLGNFTRALEFLHLFWTSGTSLSWKLYSLETGKNLVLF